MKAKSIRTFIGAKNFEESKAFYKLIGFEEVLIDNQMTYFRVNDDLGFYLQNGYVKDWVNNSMLFLEVEDLETVHQTLLDKKLSEKYKGARVSEIRNENWGREFFMYDPSGILWHFGTFNLVN